LRRRVFERTSIIVTEPVSSTKMGAFASLSQAAVSRGQSSAASFPVRSRCDSTFASLHISRCVTSAFDISSVNSATGISCLSATFAAMQRASADFPMLGRAATMMRLPGWKPEVSRSMSRKPDGVPVSSTPASYSAVILAKLSFSSSSMCANSPETRLCESSKSSCSARSTRSSVSPGRSQPSCAISLPTRISPRRVAVSRTIRA
jgi:hypothetical protein